MCGRDLYIHRVGRTARAGKGGRAAPRVAHLSICPHLHLSISLSLYVHASISLPVHLSLSVHLYLSISLFLHIFIFHLSGILPCLHQSIALSLCHNLSITPSLSLYISLPATSLSVLPLCLPFLYLSPCLRPLSGLPRPVLMSASER